MPVFKNNANGSWYVMTRYTNWKGERKQKCKRGFATKREAQEWERTFQQQNAADMDMTFGAFTQLYKKGHQAPAEGKHMADEGAYHQDENSAVLLRSEPSARLRQKTSSRGKTNFSPTGTRKNSRIHRPT